MTNAYRRFLNPAAEPATPQWNVFFDGSFWGHTGKDHAGTEITVGKQFEWAGRQWLLPAVYSCGKGLVIDFCMRVEAQEIRAFMGKWDLRQENDTCEHFTQEQQMEIELDSPLHLDFDAQLELNGRKLLTSHGCSVCYNPCLPDGMRNDLEAKWVVKHYALNPAYGWVIFRNAFPWAGQHRPKIKTLSLTMEQHPISIPGPHFRVAAAGDTVAFVHPASGKEYILTVQELEPHILPESCLDSERWEYPSHFWAMSYTINPEIPDGSLTIMDCAGSDRPKEKAPSSPAAMGIIGGADGPTAIFLDRGESGQPRAACSSLHFSPVDSVEWYIIFCEKQFDTIEITLF